MDKISSYKTKVAKKIMLCQTNVGGTDRVYFIDIGGESSLKQTEQYVLDGGKDVVITADTTTKEFVIGEKIGLNTPMNEIYPSGYQYFEDYTGDKSDIATLGGLLKNMYIPKKENESTSISGDDKTKIDELVASLIKKIGTQDVKFNVVYHVVSEGKIFLIPNNLITREFDTEPPIDEEPRVNIKEGDGMNFELCKGPKEGKYVLTTGGKRCKHSEQHVGAENKHVVISYWPPWKKHEFTNVYSKNYGNTNINKYNFYEMVGGGKFNEMYEKEFKTLIKTPGAIPKYYIHNVTRNIKPENKKADEGGAAGGAAGGGYRKKKSRRKYRKRKYKKSNRSKKMKRNKSRRKRLSKRR